MFSKSVLFVLTTLALSASGVSLGGTDQSTVCDSLANFFNILNNAIPMTISFPRGITDVGIPYPPGTLHFGSSAQKVKDCSAYTTTQAGTLIHLDLQNSLVLEFPAFSIDGETKKVTISINACNVKLHYQLKDSSGAYPVTQMNSVFADVRDLGKVTLSTPVNGTDAERDFTEEADDVIRPIIFRLLDNFAKQSLKFVAQPDENYVDGVFEAFKLVFKTSLLGVHNSIKPKVP